MAIKNLDSLSRTLSHEGNDVVIVRPGITLILYSEADVAAVMAGAADALQAYLDFIPPGAIAAAYEPAPDEYTPGRFAAFDAAARRRLLDDLSAGASFDEDEGYGFVLSATPDGQAGDYGARFGAIDLAESDDADNETSLLRFDLPWNLLDTKDVDALVDFIERTASMFPFCAGNAGMSFNHTITFMTETRDEIRKLLPRFLGFEPSYDTAQLEMRGKSPPAHWINLLSGDLVSALGGEESLRSKLDQCEVKSLGSGLLIRAAKLPPVVDVNRRGLDIGRLPVVAEALKPICFDEPTFTGLPDEQSGQEWLDRFDNLVARDWDNG